MFLYVEGQNFCQLRAGGALQKTFSPSFCVVVFHACAYRVQNFISFVKYFKSRFQVVKSVPLKMSQSKFVSSQSVCRRVSF